MNNNISEHFTLYVSEKRIQQLGKKKDPKVSIRAYRTPPSGQYIKFSNVHVINQNPLLVESIAEKDERISALNIKLENNQTESTMIRQNNAFLIMQNKRVLNNLSEERAYVNEYRSLILDGSLTRLILVRLRLRYQDRFTILKQSLMDKLWKR